MSTKTERGYISRYDRFKVLKRQHWKCAKCRCKLKYSSRQKFPGAVGHVDHIIPLAKGGIDNIENYQALCPVCNLSKGCKMPRRVRTGGMSQNELFEEIQRIDVYLSKAKYRMNSGNKHMIQHLSDLRDKLMLYTTYRGRI